MAFAPASRTCQAFSPLNPPSTSMTGSRPRSSHSRRNRADFRQHFRQELLAAKPRIDGHDQHDAAKIEHIFDHAPEASPGSAPRLRSFRDRGSAPGSGADGSSRSARNGRADDRRRPGRSRPGNARARRSSDAHRPASPSPARTASTTTGPIVMFGTNRPSITSTWIQSAPALSTARTSSASRPKSADRIDGATMTGRLIEIEPAVTRSGAIAGRCATAACPLPPDRRCPPDRFRAGRSCRSATDRGSAAPPPTRLRPRRRG